MTQDSPKPPRRRMPLNPLHEGAHSLSKDESRYLLKALRLSDGEKLEVFDGDGFYALATLLGVEAGEAYLEISKPQEAPRPELELYVATATPKGDRADWLVEKVTELGASGLIWLKTERSVVVPKPGSKKFERWARLSDAAARQSGRMRVPSLEGPLTLAELDTFPFDHRFVASPIKESESPIPSALKGRVLITIGPEGGFTDHELEQLKNSGYNLLWLNPHVLRTETAAIAAAAVLTARL